MGWARCAPFGTRAARVQRVARGPLHTWAAGQPPFVTIVCHAPLFT
ncbi:hypothetical protein BURPS406E_H0160 [Burkholderia pseudomallei 406e]|uniref:Uncharacterized protein n=2 Tax=Burkholderia pseudomallei TaxID=28450 RepID=A0A0E1W7F9_BURPE|nr:hypothetical protein BURPS668_2746 [Burkholderia pseudomallei 668]ABN89796.1 hypothetical protein BURPS1106A_2806 [Burkholderia pseudomallei 1106a]ACQ98674.1 conserved hypothetical protein [Burkholderia pseudomallei MSHR346]EBA51368.1 hypothetical protein BURPS305_7475 [Burkholderia pseudomallei 305]EDO83939.1 hypothetical protein BURPS406E_H0160 [Burkholderia pseudomallei 406e]EDO94613.1 hypothetical protein BURPSPAST_R0068 [Burkholderia pseudomallei Pasteur 52237]EDS85388.1 hypothetical 